MTNTFEILNWPGSNLGNNQLNQQSAVLSLSTGPPQVCANFMFSVCPEHCQFLCWLDKLLGFGELSSINQQITKSSKKGILKQTLSEVKVEARMT